MKTTLMLLYHIQLGATTGNARRVATPRASAVLTPALFAKTAAAARLSGASDSTATRSSPDGHPRITFGGGGVTSEGLAFLVYVHKCGKAYLNGCRSRLRPNCLGEQFTQAASGGRAITDRQPRDQTLPAQTHEDTEPPPGAAGSPGPAGLRPEVACQKAPPPLRPHPVPAPREPNLQCWGPCPALCTQLRQPLRHAPA